ncbi:hypothetical protein V3O24_13280 [Methylobacter sp. Wu8]|uniref:hypothetical protein n=1 Tax=Methylobacter sp. Wu8 TaxID=3118457 RepID=UPI002F343F99
MTTLEVHNITIYQTIDSPDLWMTYSFAPEWLADAKAEAEKPENHHSARRREIIFSVAFAESYLVEWVRDEILQRDFQKFFELFPTSAKFSAKEKWKEIPKILCQDGLLKGTPSLKNTFWVNWCILVNYRDGLIHAVSSRPSGTSVPEEAALLPSVDKLAALKPGWAVNIALELVSNFHMAAETKLPEWLKTNA